MTKRRKPPELAETGRSYRIKDVRRDSEYRMPSGFTYSTPGQPCSDKFDKLKRGKCLTQLAFDRGRPVVRFCEVKGKPGRLVPVDGPRQAAEIARRGCDCFEVTRAYDQCLPGGLRLGATGRQRTRREAASRTLLGCGSRRKRT